MTGPWTNLNDHNTDTEDYRGIALPGGRAYGQTGGGAGQIDRQGLNVPSKPVVKQVGSGSSQRDRRFTDTFWDEHRTGPGGRFPKGRPWCGEREISAMADRNEPAGFVHELMKGEHVVDDNGNNDRAATFASVWDAPWTPIAKYFKYDYRRSRITFNYRQMLVDETEGFNRYFEAAAKLGAGMNIRVDYGQTPVFAITSLLGFPTKMIPIAEAAIAQDPWLLGFIDEPNEKLRKILGFNERGMRMLSYIPESQPVVTPQQVLSTETPKDLDALIAAAVAKAMAERDAAEAKKKAEHGAKVKAGMAKKKASSAPTGSAA